MKDKLLFGITESGIMHTDEDPNISIENKFKKVKSSGVYDYLDKTPLKEDIYRYLNFDKIPGFKDKGREISKSTEDEVMSAEIK